LVDVIQSMLRGLKGYSSPLMGEDEGGGDNTSPHPHPPPQWGEGDSCGHGGEARL